VFTGLIPDFLAMREELEVVSNNCIFWYYNKQETVQFHFTAIQYSSKLDANYFKLLSSCQFKSTSPFYVVNVFLFWIIRNYGLRERKFLTVSRQE
jgi:hypothetical protein